MGIEPVDDFAVGSEDRNDHRLRDSGLGAEAGEAVTQAVKAVNGRFLLAPGNGNRGLQPDPLDDTQDINIYEAITDTFAAFVDDLVTGCDVGTDTPVPAAKPRTAARQSAEKLLCRS